MGQKEIAQLIEFATSKGNDNTQLAILLISIVMGFMLTVIWWQIKQYVVTNKNDHECFRRKLEDHDKKISEHSIYINDLRKRRNNED